MTGKQEHEEHEDHDDFDPVRSLALVENVLRHQVLGNVDRLGNDLRELLEFVYIETDEEKVKYLISRSQLILSDNEETIRAFIMFRLKAMLQSFDSFIKDPVREQFGRISRIKKTIRNNNP